MVYPNSVSPFNIVVSTGDGPTRLGNILKWILNIEGCLLKKSFEKNSKRVWVHTCSLDHKNALKNYLSRGMKIYNIETVSTKSA